MDKKVYEKEVFAEIAETFDEVDRRILLWENSAPYDSFDGQTIELDLKAYDAIEVEYIDFNYESQRLVMAPLRISIGKNGGMAANPFGGSGWASGVHYCAFRKCSPTTTGVTFDSGYGGYPNTGWTARNDMCIPQKIYGFQFGASAGSIHQDIRDVEDVAY